jgi:hypothetical protein
MENGAYALLPLLGVLALISRVRENRRKKNTESKLEETRPPSFELPEETKELYLDLLQQKTRVWHKLIHLHVENQWRHGVYEQENYIESTFQIAENTDAYYRYILTQEDVHFESCILHSFPQEKTTDLFVLAAHFNNLLTFGKVVVDVNRQIVLFTHQNEVSFYAVYPVKIEYHLSRHYHISKDIYWAFQKLLTEQEEPAFIIADLITIQKNNQENTIKS